MPKDRAKSITTSELVKFALGAAQAVRANRALINDMNVFPVPDNDTGTNMTFTLEQVQAAAESNTEASVAEASQAMAHAALMGAKGNSGLILSQFFKGLAEGLQNTTSATVVAVAEGLKTGTELSYRAVQNPTEGTILSVMRAVAECADQASKAEANNFEQLLKACGESATEAVKNTPNQLERLREAGVVDAGGYGFAIALYGGYATLAGDDATEVRLALEGATQATVTPSTEFLTDANEEAWGYCTVFALTGTALDVTAIKAKMESLGRSTVVAGDNTAVRVHVHSMDPGEILSAGIHYGELRNIEIGNMEGQLEEWVKARAKASDKTTPPVATAVVAVAAGKGVVEIIEQTGLGALEAVTGDGTMSPSPKDLLEAVARANSEQVIIMANDKNVIGIANLAAEVATKNVTVFESRSVPQGITALLAFSPDETLNSNVRSMYDAIRRSHSGDVRLAVKDSKVDGFAIERGMFVGTVGGTIVSADRSPVESVIDAIQAGDLAIDGALVSIYFGTASSMEEAEQLEAEIRRRMSGVEVEVLDGGQPYAHFMFGVE